MKIFCFALALFISTIAMSFVVSETKPRFKNLKVLPKNTTKEQMDSVMKSFTVALGVKCNFCHEFNQEQKAMDFASDGNHHKKIARDMIKMTQKINRKFFDVDDSKSLTTSLEVTCYTCHNGKTDPRKGPEVAQRQGNASENKNR
jgi:5-methylcytosine-specific restriction endonuclease McrA